MPELPEVETVRRGLEQISLGIRISGGSVLHPRTIAHPDDFHHFLSGLQDRAIHRWQRRGKYLLAQLTPLPTQITEDVNPTQRAGSQRRLWGGWLGVHLRMTGQLLWVRPDEPLAKHTRVRLFFDDTHELRFVDQRTFGRMWWVPPKQEPEQVISGLKALGPEPFSADFSVQYLRQHLGHRRRPIKNAVLDQSILAGIGNIYADEALFLSGIHPTTLCCKLTSEQIERLHTAILQVLETGIAQGGTTFSHFRNALGINGNYAGMAWVYQRSGEPCRNCDTPIQRIKLAGRSTHFCPQCQRGDQG